MVDWFVHLDSNKRWFRPLACAVVFLCAGILFWASGGFPPWAWRFLFHVLTQLPILWAAQGSAILVPLLGLLFLSVALFIMWSVLLIGLGKLLLHWWHDGHASEPFSRDLLEAEQMAERMIQQEVSRQAMPSQSANFQAAWQPRSAPLFSPPERQPQSVQPAQSYAVARASRPLRAASGAGPVSTFTPNRSASASHSSPPVATTGSLSSRREQLRLVPREPETIPEPESDYETLFGFEHALIETSDPLLLHSAPLPDSAPLQDVHTEELESALRLVVGIGLDPGIVRKDAPNEDNLFAIQAMRTGKSGPHPVGLFIVADGMGGHADGQEASRLAVQVISDAIVPALLRVDADEDSFSDLLKDGIHRANLALYRRNRELPEMMGTTLTAALVVDDRAYIANVGDSRTYLYRPQKGLKQVTRDHSLVARMVEDGALTRDEIYTHPRRNQIYRCLGERASVEVDNFVLTLSQDDVLLLCSDGLWEMVHDKTIQRIIAASATHPSQISTHLIQSALSRGGADNISVVVVCVTQPEE